MSNFQIKKVPDRKILEENGYLFNDEFEKSYEKKITSDKYEGAFVPFITLGYIVISLRENVVRTIYTNTLIKPEPEYYKKLSVELRKLNDLGVIYYEE